MDVIEIYFLCVGHTHGQIDQMFSCFARFIRLHPTRTLPELSYALKATAESYYKRSGRSRAPHKETAEELKKPFKQRKVRLDTHRKEPVKIQVIESVVDVASWLETFLEPSEKHNVEITKKHAFQLTRAGKDGVDLRTKMWAADAEWLVSLPSFFPISLHLGPHSAVRLS